ncbi:MAG: NUDIX hydrolase [Prevotella sp.]|nr:NUDIX hydrolase [Prevotella sp.]
MAEESKKEYWKPSVTADVVVIDSRLAKHRDDGTFINVLLIKRSSNSDAYPDCWAIPGGFLEENESLEDCAVRELKEETGLLAKMLVPVGTFSRVGRDPRGRVISNAYLTVMMSTKEEPLPIKAGDDAKDIGLFRLKGSFSEVDGSLSVSLWCAEKKIGIEFKARFSRDRLGLVATEIKFDTATKLAFDHAEIIARTILRVPDLVLPTKTKPIIEDGDDEDNKESSTPPLQPKNK